MNKRFHQGDVVHIEAIVEVDTGESANLIVKGHGGVEQRIKVPKTIVTHYERGPIKAGDVVRKKVKSGTVEGKVLHRVGDHAWIEYGEGAHAVEAVSALTR